MTRRALTVLLLSVGLAALAACGKSAPSKADYLAKADPVCKRGNELAAVASTPSDVAGLKDFTTKLADNLDKTTKELDELDTPGGDDGDAAEAMVKSMKDAAAALRAVGPDVDAANFTAIEDNGKKASDALKNADAQARAFGSTECGKGEAEAGARMQTALAPAVKNAYIAKVDPICAATDKQVEALAEPESEAQVKDYLTKLLGIAEKSVAEMRAVPAPRTDKDKLDAFFGAQDKLVNTVRETIAVLSDESKLETNLGELAKAGVDGAAKAGAYGFKECSKTD
ncbi:MAG TPA: hypothetical protein VM938_06420 [Acidimicrobiales bacterium]|nr:hypothetical protein [Acidimicrobiales bacterium]